MLSSNGICELELAVQAVTLAVSRVNKQLRGDYIYAEAIWAKECSA